MVTWMVNVTLWVMGFVHSRSKSHTNLIPMVFLPRLLVPLLQLYNRVVRIKVKAVLRPPDMFATLQAWRTQVCSITITAALLNTNCFMWIPHAEGYINIELDKVLFFSFYVLFFLSFLTLQQHPQVGLALSRCRHLLQKVAAPLW